MHLLFIRKKIFIALLQKVILFASLCCLVFLSFVNSFNLKKQSNDFLQEDIQFIKNVSRKCNHDTIPILIFLTQDNYKNCNDLVFWIVYNDILPLTQMYSNKFLFTLGNPELFFNIDENIHAEDIYVSNLIPISKWKKGNEKKDIWKFVKENKIEFLYFIKGSVIPDEIQLHIKEMIQSDLTGNQMCIVNLD